MIIKNRNGEFSVNSAQYNYLTHIFDFNKIDGELVGKTIFIKSSWEYEKADKIFKSDEKYKDKLR